jgi:hypothetical protein
VFCSTMRDGQIKTGLPSHDRPRRRHNSTVKTKHHRSKSLLSLASPMHLLAAPDAQCSQHNTTRSSHIAGSLRLEPAGASSGELGCGWFGEADGLTARLPRAMIALDTANPPQGSMIRMQRQPLTPTRVLPTPTGRSG